MDDLDIEKFKKMSDVAFSGTADEALDRLRIDAPQLTWTMKADRKGGVRMNAVDSEGVSVFAISRPAAASRP